jgi:hypothetical protein
MPDLSFAVESAAPEPHAAAPLLVFKLRISQAAMERPVAVQSIALRCQVRIEPARRRYNADEQGGLFDLFGEPAEWGRTLRGLLWAHTQTIVPPFTGSTVADLPVPCSYDFTAAATRYFHALEGGDVPLCLLFSGTIFYTAPDGRLQVCQVPWDKEADFRLPTSVWQDMMDRYYPGCAWLCVPRDLLDRLGRYKRRLGLAGWDQALESLLPAEAVPQES